MQPNTLPALERFLHALPKVELHCHLLGAVRRATFEDLARRAARSNPRADAQAPPSAADIEAYYQRGDRPVGVLRAQHAQHTHRLVASLIVGLDVGGRWRRLGIGPGIGARRTAPSRWQCSSTLGSACRKRSSAGSVFGCNGGTPHTRVRASIG